jgi:hypothetical protein
VSLAPGSRLGPYEIVELLGAGGMGEVYRARDTRLDRAVAVKILSPGVASSPDARQRFEREARTVSQLSHPHICGGGRSLGAGGGRVAETERGIGTGAIAGAIRHPAAGRRGIQRHG